MRKTVVATLVAVALIAAACGDDDDTGGTTDGRTDEGTTGGDGGDAAEITVKIDGQADDFNSSFFAYFPDEVTVRPGDTIVYESVFTGEPHSITFGTVVQDAIDFFETIPPEMLESDEPPPPELEAQFEEIFGAIPPMLPEGPGDAIQTSVNPCFVATGDIPDDPESPCPVTEPEPFTGTETFYNSGFLPDAETFELQLSEDIEPGTYQGFCTLHFTEMISTVTVVAADQEIPTPGDVESEGQAQLDGMVSRLAPALDDAEGAAQPGSVQAGAVSEEEPKGLINEFIPGDVEVSAGDAVTWTVFGPHTVSFNASEDVRVVLSRGDDGYFHLNPDSVSPAGFDAPPPPEGEPEGPPEPVDAGTWDGTGFLSSGIMFGGDFTITFGEAGTYDYFCLIHPDMEGTVTVT